MTLGEQAVYEDDVAGQDGTELRAMPRSAINEVAAPATRAAEKVRLFIVMMSP